MIPVRKIRDPMGTAFVEYVRKSDYDAAVQALRDLYAMVAGECPSLLENDINAEMAQAILDSQTKSKP